MLGRDFSKRDGSGAVAVAIVNEAFARQFFGGGHPLGQQISIPNRYRPMEIVGVVKDTVSQSLRQAAPPSVYLPYFQYLETLSFASFEIRAESSIALTGAMVRDTLNTKFPDISVKTQILTLNEQVQRTLTQERMLAALGVCFGALALILAAVGLYGLLAYTVSRSTSEIGIRMALGAERTEVLGRVFRSALRLLAFGIALGIPAAWACSRLVASMLFGLTATDPLTILGATVLLGTTAIVAAFVPALRASKIDPMVALRYE